MDLRKENKMKSPDEKPLEFKPTSWALKNKNTIYLLTIVLFIFGGAAYTSLPKELFPEIVQPIVMVRTVYPGNPPVDIENLITRPLEKEIESVKNLKKMTSFSSADASIIFAEFNTNVNVKQVLQDVKDAVDKGKSELPDDLMDDPVVEDVDFSEFPIININLSGNYSLEELREYAEFLEDEIETVSEITRVDISGVTEKEVRVDVDQHKLEANQLNFEDIQAAIKQENVSMSGGDILLGGSRRSVRVVGEFKDPKEIRDIIVKHEDGNIVYLRDIANVAFTFKEPESFARLNHKPVVSLQVVKKSGENLLSATDQIFALIDKAKNAHALPAGLDVTITNDQSQDIRSQLSNLSNSMLMGVIFVVLVLFFFLGPRNAFIVGFAIPLSMFLSFVILGFMGMRINMMVLFSLILALGMLVDNAIVVVENIFRFRQRGYGPMAAAKLAVGEIAMPIISSTATTLAAFFPLLFWKDIIGEFMKFLPLTLIIVLSSSLFVALVLLPVYSSLFVKQGDQNPTPKKARSLVLSGIFVLLGLVFFFLGYNTIGNILVILAVIGMANLFFLNKLSRWFQTRVLVWLENFYSRVLNGLLKGIRPYMVIMASFILLGLTLFFYFVVSKPKVSFFPSTDPKFINILAKLPVGTDITVTDSVIRVIENKVYSILEPDSTIVKSVLSRVGNGAVGQNEGLTNRQGSGNKGLITVHFVDYEFRNNISTALILHQLSDSLIRTYPGVEISVEKQAEGPPAGKPINIELIGKDFDKLIALSDTLIAEINMAGIPGIEGLKIDLDIGKPEVMIDVDRERARRFGISTGQIANTLRTALYGVEVSKYKEGEDDYPIMLRSKDQYRYNLTALLNQKITFKDPNGKLIQIPISAVADIRYTSTYDQINRKDKKRVITVHSNVLEGYNATEINNEIKPILQSFQFPEGYTYDVTGEQEEQAKSMAFLMSAMLIAMALILIILVTQFNSIFKPVIILVSVLFSTIGVFGGLATFDMEFIVIMTGIGIVSLAGVVVNNAIVLIDYIDLLIKRKKFEMKIDEERRLPMEYVVECIADAGKTRLRPVLLTAITTILGLIPLATGLNIDLISFLENYNPHIYFGGDNEAFWGPISWTIIFGLTFSTFLTLLVVPCMYLAMYKVQSLFEKEK